MASGDEGRSTGAPGNGNNGHGRQAPPRGGPRGGRILITIDGEDLALMLAGHDQLQRAAEQYLATSTREHELLSRINNRLEGQVAALQQQIAILTAELNLRRGESSAAPGGDNKPQ